MVEQCWQRTSISPSKSDAHTVPIGYHTAKYCQKCGYRPLSAVKCSGHSLNCVMTIRPLWCFQRTASRQHSARRPKPYYPTTTTTTTTRSNNTKRTRKAKTGGTKTQWIDDNNNNNKHHRTDNRQRGANTEVEKAATRAPTDSYRQRQRQRQQRSGGTCRQQ